MAGLLNKIKQDAARSGGNRADFFFVREGEKKRVRFLQELDDGYAVDFHKTKWGAEEYQFFVCNEALGKECDYCEDEDYQKQTQYCWSVWDYETNAVKIFMYPVNRCSPIPPLMEAEEIYGSMMDRDFVITVTGKQTNKTFTVNAMDKSTFKNKKAKALSESALLDKIAKAYPQPGATESDADEEWDEGEEDGGKPDYESMKPMELYKLCRERNIKVEPKKSSKYYAKKLSEADAAEDDWDDEEDDWEDED